MKREKKEMKSFVIHQASSPRHVVGDLPLVRRYQTQGVFSYLTNNTQKGDSRQKHSGMTILFSGRAFTLIELLVVVLIIGILSAIALPQYQKAVEKSRVTEVLQNIRILEEQAKLYVLENGWPASGSIDLKDVASVELSGGGFWNNSGVYETKNFWYGSTVVGHDGIEINVSRKSPPYYYQLVVQGNDLNALAHQCWNGVGDEMGIKICHSLEGLGWTYTEGEL